MTLEREGLGAFERDPDLNPEHLQFTKAMAEASAVLDAPGAEYTYLSWHGLPPRLDSAAPACW